MTLFCPHCHAPAQPNGIKCFNCGGWINPLPVPPGPHGNCPQCKSSALEKITQYDNHHTGCSLTASGVTLIAIGIPLLFFFAVGMIVIGVGIILFVVGHFMPNRRAIGGSLKCMMCGHQWRV